MEPFFTTSRQWEKNLRNCGKSFREKFESWNQIKEILGIKTQYSRILELKEILVWLKRVVTRNLINFNFIEKKTLHPN